MSAWIEIIKKVRKYLKLLSSHSLWVRGLKYWWKIAKVRAVNCRTPCECVDWNNYFYFCEGCWNSRTPCECVDWNTGSSTYPCEITPSHSLWVRGLKFLPYHECVFLKLVALLVSVWIEIFCWLERQIIRIGRTPCECVDWNVRTSVIYRFDLAVALLVSAWIEIYMKVETFELV